MKLRLSSGFFAVALALFAWSGCSSNTTTPKSLPISPTPGLGTATYVNGALTPLRAPGTSASLLTMTVTSSAFTNGGTLPASAPGPAANGCSTSGTTTSPALSWTPGPSGTQTYMITMFDPDAPTGVGFVHWVIFDIPATVTSIPAGYGTPGSATLGGIDGWNDQGYSGYTGPCPPAGDGAHHYWITVSALNVAMGPILSQVGFTVGTSTSTVGLAGITFFVRQNSAVLAQGQIVGTYGH
jgi:Raf kinase inhibitor-like YbhB/YbcL family protein